MNCQRRNIRNEFGMKHLVVVCLLIISLPQLTALQGATRPEAPPPNSADIYPKPTFEPMSLEQYKTAHPELAGLDCGIEEFFDTFIYVFGMTIAAMPKTPVPEIIHAAKLYAQLIDNNEDFIPDDRRIFEYHQKDPEGKNYVIVLVDTKALDNAWIAFEPGQPFWVSAQALRPGHSGVGHSRDGEMDIAVEELFHKYGKAFQSVYPKDFGLPQEEDGETWTSTLSEAMDRARGIDRTVKPVNGEWIYPEGAWYTYSARSCGWGCQLDEYLWHIWATNIGYNAILTRAPGIPKEEAKPQGWCENLHSEWRPCTRQDLKEMDLPAYQLLNNKGYQLPTRIPFGEYAGNRVEHHGYEVETRFGNETRFTINRTFDSKLTLKRGNTYFFDQSLKSNTGFPLRFTTSKDDTDPEAQVYREGVEINGVPGKRGSYVKITVTETAPDRLYPYCSSLLGIAGESLFVVED